MAASALSIFRSWGKVQLAAEGYCMHWGTVVSWVVHSLSDAQAVSLNPESGFFAHNIASAFSKLRLLAKFPLTLEIT